MPGTIVFKPIEANLVHNTDFITKMNPYCTFIVDGKRFNSLVCKKGGKHPHWSDSVSVPVPMDSRITVELMDKDRITKDDTIGSFTIDLPELQNTGGQSSKWYPLQYKNKPAGEILLETALMGEPGFGGSGFEQAGFSNQSAGIGVLGGSNMMQREEVILEQPAVIQEEVIVNRSAEILEPRQTYVEQRQTVEPHTFLKEIDVIETRPVLQEIEVFEPRKVMKEVQFTEIVPVRKIIDNVDVQVVQKEIEVMEPRLVRKQIQVIENVPVTKQVEVIESVSSYRDVEVYEPQTFTKQVQVTEQVPVMKTITVTEPVHLKRAVEFVEDIITTQTITKEIKPEVVVNQQITKSVGPATYIGEITELRQKFGHITLNEQERIRYLGISEQQQVYLNEEEKWRWHEARRLSYGNQYGASQQYGAGQQYGGQYGSQGMYGGQSQYGMGSQLPAGNYSNSTGMKNLGSAEKKHHHSLFHKKF